MDLVRIVKWNDPSIGLHIQNGTAAGPLTLGNAPNGWWSAQWELIWVTVAPYTQGDFVFRIRNKWVPEWFLNIENGPLQATSVPDTFVSSFWQIWAYDSVDPSVPFQYVIKNMWKHDMFISLDNPSMLGSLSNNVGLTYLQGTPIQPPLYRPGQVDPGAG